MSNETNHIHAINKSSFHLYKDAKFIGCELCGKNLAEILIEATNKAQDGHS